MAATYDVETDVGTVRLLISDIGGTDGKSFLFQDNEIQKFIDIKGGALQLAAAAALRTIAGNIAQVLKRITFLELETDGGDTAKALRELAQDLVEAEDEDQCFEIVKVCVDEFSRREIIRHRLQRENQ
jgi:hypothetical protein